MQDRSDLSPGAPLCPICIQVTAADGDVIGPEIITQGILINSRVSNSPTVITTACPIQDTSHHPSVNSLSAASRYTDRRSLVVSGPYGSGSDVPSGEFPAADSGSGGGPVETSAVVSGTAGGGWGDSRADYGTGSLEGREKRHQSVASTGSAASSDSSAAKRTKRLAKKVPSMSPGAKWRRLRNTLKAAHEMQAPKKKSTLSRDDSFLRKFSTRNQRLHSQSYPSNDDGSYATGSLRGSVTRNSNEPRSFKPSRSFAVPHDGNFMFNWLGVVTVAVLYNLWTCILRQAFREVQRNCHACWFTFDALVDVIYLLDILVQFRTGYLNQGLMVYDSKKLARRYIQSRLLYVDSLCLFPLDFLQFYVGVHPMLRFPRFLKVYRTFRFIHMLESRTAYPNLIRVANLTHILFLGAHWFAAFYYMISEAEDFKGQWSYPRPEGEYAFISRKYLASLFWSTLTLTTIGDLPPPENGKEYVFVIVSYLIGVFVFATIVGQVGNVINNRNASRQEFERLLDGAKVYMQTHNVPSDLQKRVQRWYDYVWSRGRLNGCDINSLGLLPDKLKTELAIHVNLETLKKVTIFQECQPEFLHDLVLKMKAYIFTPGDLICRRGEVAREMFIIADGVVEIISESGTVLKQMGAGDFFGEIGILNLDGGINRRTADVRSVGYSELFVLSRDDVLAALKDHPDAESIIRDYGQRRLREIEAHRQLVKPLKQLGSAGRRYLRNVTSGPNATSVSPGAGAGAAGTGGGNTTGNAYTYCYMNEDPDGRVDFSNPDRTFFRSVCSNVRRIFHRKVRRQKAADEPELTSVSAGDAIKTEGKLAWMVEEQRHRGNNGLKVKLCCTTSSTDNRLKQDYIPVPMPASPLDPLPKDQTKDPTGTFYSPPSGYTAVLTEEEENSRCPSPQSPVRPLEANAVIENSGSKLNHTSPEEHCPHSTMGGQTVAEMNRIGAHDVATTEIQSGLPTNSENLSDIRSNVEERKLGHSCSDLSRSNSAYSVTGDSCVRNGQTNSKKYSVIDESNLKEGDACLRRRSSETGKRDCQHDRRLSDSSARSPEMSDQFLYDIPANSLPALHDQVRELNPCIRVESASTLDSEGHASQVEGSQFLHPEYLLHSASVTNGNYDDADDVVRRCRSRSAPNIVAHALSGTSAHPLLPCGGAATHLSSSGSSVAVDAIAAPSSASRNNLFQRRLSSWAKLDGSKRNSPSNNLDLLESPRTAAWTPATDSLMQPQVLDDDHVIATDHEHVTSLLLQLQASHSQLHSRMRELEVAYASNADMLQRLGATQANMLALLTAQTSSTNNRASRMPSGMHPMEAEENMTAL